MGKTAPYGIRAVVALALLALGSVWARAQDPIYQVRPFNDTQRKAAESAEQLARDGKRGNALRLAYQLRKNLGSKRHPRVEALIAQIALAENKTEIALRHVEPYLKNRNKYHRPFFYAYLQGGYTYLKLEKHHDAMSLFDWLATSENKGQLMLQALAVEGVGRTYLAQRNLPEARKAFTFALHNLKRVYLPKAREKAKYYDEPPPDLDYLVKRIERLLKQATPKKPKSPKKPERPKRPKKSGPGPDYYKFRQAETLRRHRQNHVEALRVYKDLIDTYPDSPYSEAARLYAPICMAKLGAHQAAEEELKTFVAANEYGLYRGEALLETGRIAIEYQFDAEIAFDGFERLDAWIKEVRKPNRSVAAPAVPAVERGRIQPPKERETVDAFWGNKRAARIEPGQLLNRATAAWYLDDLELRCAKFRIFLAITKNDKRNAVAELERLKRLDPSVSEGNALLNPNDYTRLRFGAENGYLIAYPQELRLFNNRQKFVVQLADFYLVTRQFEKARTTYERLLPGKSGPLRAKLSAKQVDFVYFGIAQAIYHGGGDDNKSETLCYLEKILASIGGTWTEYRAAFEYAKITQLSGNVSQRAKGQRLLAELARSPKDNQYTNEAKLLVALQLLHEGKFDDARTILRRVPATDESRSAQARAFLEGIDDPNSRLWEFVPRKTTKPSNEEKGE